MIYSGKADIGITGFYDNGIDYKLTVKPQYQDFMTTFEYQLKGDSKEMYVVL